MWDFFQILISISGWATPPYTVNFTAIAKVLFFTCSLMLMLRPDKLLQVFINFCWSISPFMLVPLRGNLVYFKTHNLLKFKAI